MNRSGAGLLTLVILFSLLTNSAPRNGGEQNRQPAAQSKGAASDSIRPKTLKATPAVPDYAFSNYPAELQDTLTGFYSDEAEGGNGMERCPASAISTTLLNQIKSEMPAVLLAIVPDPVHTHLSLFFDRQIDAIQQAAQDRGYYFDRAIMPWDSKEHLESTDFRIRLQQEHDQRCRAREPGLMIFRRGMYGDQIVTDARRKREGQRQARTSGADESNISKSLYDGTLLVFVVGETPTSGIRKDQFRGAVHYMVRLLPDETRTLQILGPTFSGSLFSLRALIESNQKMFRAFRIYSGTANSYQSIEQFRKSDLPQNTTFASFQETAELQELLFVRFLLGRGFDVSQIAVLAEDETAYGEFGANSNPSGSTQRSEEKQSCMWNCPTNTDESYKQIQRSVVHLYFPREIAQFRSAYQRDVAVERIGGSDKEAARSTLRRDLTDTGSDDDSVQTYSHRQLPLSQEAVLLGIVTTLHKHATEFVILRSTDPLDTVLLARYLRSASPNLRIVTAGNDLLLRREIEDRLLFGILSINTYSMRPGADELLPYPSSWPVHKARVFPGPDSVGTYNAMTALLSPNDTVEGATDVTQNGRLCKSNAAVDGRIRLCPDVGELEEYGWPSLGGHLENCTSEAPPVWVTVLGRDGFWPVALLTPCSNVMDPEDPVSRLPLLDQGMIPPEKGFRPPATWAWRALCGVISVFAVLYIWLLLGASALSTSQVSQQLAARATDCRLSAFAIQGLLLLAALSLVLWPSLHGRLEGCWLWTITLGTIALALLLVVALDLRRRWSHVRSPGIVVSAFVFVGMLWILFRCVGDDSATNIFIYRYVHTAWWVSPLMPVLFLVGAGLWWSWYTIQGATLLDERRPLLPRTQEEIVEPVHDDAPPDKFNKVEESKKNPESPQNLKHAHGGTVPPELEYLSEDEHEIEELLSVLVPGKWSHKVNWAVIALVGLTVFLSDYCHPVSSLEGRWYDLVFGILLLAAVGAMLSSLLRLYFIWMDTKRLLIRLDATRLRHGFSRLPGYSWMPFWGLGSSPLPDRERLARLEVEALQTAITTMPVNDRQEFTDRFDEVRDAIGKLQNDRTHSGLFERLRTLFSSDSKDAQRLQDLKNLYVKIARAAGALLSYLSEIWKTEEYQEPGKSSPGHNETELHLHCNPISSEESAKENSKNAMKAAEDFVALVYASFIQVILIRLRSLIVCACGMFVFIVASLNVYPFGPKGSLNSLSVILLLVIVLVIGFVFGQVRRDTTLSLITDTKEGQLGADFWLKLAQFGALPLLSLLTTLYPEIGSFLFSWLEPAMQALGR
jgi:hypothetical protein